MNEFQRRGLDLAQNSLFLASYIKANSDIVGADSFGYGGQMDNIAANGVGSTSINILADSYFVCTYISAAAWITATGAASAANFTIQITDKGTGKTFYNIPTLLSLVAGSAGFPFFLAAPRLIAPQTIIQLDVTNLTATAGISLQVTLQGARIFYGSNSGG